MQEERKRFPGARNAAFSRFCHRFFTIIIMVVLMGLPAFASDRADSDRLNDTLFFVSDTQAPLFVETIIHHAPFNQVATGMIFNDILARNPKSVFLLGDLVAAGSKPRRWSMVDRFIDSVRKGNGRVWACLGNHEYIYNAKLGVAAFQKRFPDHDKTGYYIIRDSVAVVLLNSNFSRLTTAEQRKQRQFYETALKQLDENDSVKAIIVACHHAPYSNSKVVGSNLRVRDVFVMPFLKTGKCALFLSGHSHNFEHFRIEGKTFLVIGGGGGVAQVLNTKGDRIACENEDCHPLFHYLMVKRNGVRLQVICREVTADLKGFNNVLSLEIKTGR